MSQAACTTEMLFQNSDYFVAMLDNGGICIGLSSMYRTDFPAGHEMFDMIFNSAMAANPDAIEELSDEIYAIHLQGGDCRALLSA